MDFGPRFLSEEQIAMREEVRKFAQRDVASRAAEIDRTAEFPWDLYKKMADMGLLALTLPEEVGGAAVNLVGSALIREEIARVSATVASLQAVSLEGSHFLVNHAPAHLRDKYLPRMMRGEIVSAFCLTEPTSGSDARGIRTRAVRDGDNWVITGSKQWVTLGAIAEYGVVICVTDPAKERGNVSAILVDLKNTPGIHIGKAEELAGLRGTKTAPIQFDNVRVPYTNLMGEEGQGLRLGLDQINKGRISVAASAVGIADGAFQAALRYSKERVQFGKPIFDFQGVQFKLAQMAMRIDAARLLYLTAASMQDKGEGSVQLASEAKLFASDSAAWITDEAVQIFGGYGYSKQYPVERYWRDAKIMQIFEGTNNIQHVIIAREVAKTLAA
ncbi:acyl-CoA dehydrogenase family protein [Mesorhizobium sp.]|uniref:acyl-CoA dehydrogenase family protein n=1 Tax=Mesorhizobium sp. TaxID=1871066 RepID=UPI000FEA82D6|nr:acyl-CoA dehydrogenase family protein [Mesorhizobium sp.]RWI88902.1 MAG: acyl-CoA dehydrogenase [Mesorhizobium sp.]